MSSFRSPVPTHMKSPRSMPVKSQSWEVETGGSLEARWPSSPANLQALCVVRKPASQNKVGTFEMAQMVLAVRPESWSSGSTQWKDNHYCLHLLESRLESGMAAKPRSPWVTGQVQTNLYQTSCGNFQCNLMLSALEKIGGVSIRSSCSPHDLCPGRVSLPWALPGLCFSCLLHPAGASTLL